MASKAAVDKEGEEALTRKAVGSGPMTFVEWVTGDHITLKKWDKYWEKGEDGQPLPYVDGANLRVIVNETVGVTEIRTGNLELYCPGGTPQLRHHSLLPGPGSGRSIPGSAW